MTERCRSEDCRAELDWALPAAGSGPAHPVDHDSAGAPDGGLEVWRDGAGVLRYRVLRKGEDPAAGRRRGRSHFGTCAHPEQWRRPRRVT